tara:strand:- start:255 stop:1076 length:822 start_codon:yes stop_codon:yes gene_type:complete
MWSPSQMMKTLFAVMMWFGFTASAAEIDTSSVDWRESADVAALFQQAGVDGTFVLFDLQEQSLEGFNLRRANQRYTPSGTFNIAHTLIGLSTGAVSSLDEVVPYPGGDQRQDAWERDMSLREAFLIANDAFYQALAREIGPSQMQQHISALIYGNREFESTLDPFWEEGILHISAVEQVRFLSLLVRDALPYPRELLSTVRELMLLESGDNWQLYGDTGWENAPEAGVGWWIGWLQKDGRWYTFALNMDIEEPADANERLSLGKASLQALGLL